MSFDFGQAVIDNEIALMVKRVRGGFDFSAESASLAEIKATGPAGMFAANPQTLARMHTATFMPELADRQLRERWQLEGASTIHQRAMNKALDILSVPNSHVIEADVDQSIRNAFEGIVAGNATLPAGWVRHEVGAQQPTRGRRVNRRRRATAETKRVDATLL